ncbi:hypothetical protein PC128_g24988 [Phytophthora cactorum]|nr:hypothetical protein PC128_g24988 [Phytophthora cactorum]
MLETEFVPSNSSNGSGEVHIGVLDRTYRALLLHGVVSSFLTAACYCFGAFAARAAVSNTLRVSTKCGVAVDSQRTQARS